MIQSHPADKLPPWEEADLPAPPPVNFRNKLRMAGPGAILLAASIGGGEWLIGPAAAVQYGAAILGLVTIAIILQVIFNLEGIRYTLYTGEPIYGGFLRLKPGPRFWTPFYLILSIVHLGWPALAAAAASTLIASRFGRLPTDADASLVHWVAGLILVGVFLLLSFGGTVERMLELASVTMLVLVFSFLLVVNVFFVPWEVWAETFFGFFRLSGFGHDLDWVLVGALAGTAAAGGLSNLTITNLMRDKGYGMGALTGAIPSAIGGRRVQVSHFGKIFPVTEANLRNWKDWWRYVRLDQIWLWGGGAFVGMFLNVNLALGVIPQGTKMSGMAVGIYQAQYMAETLWYGFWALTLLNGFWVLLSTQLGDTDILIRTMTDLLWLGNHRVRNWRGGRIQVVYYVLLGFYTLAGLYLVRVATPLILFEIMANTAALVMVIGGIQIFIVNRKFLPHKLQAPWWRQAGLLACVAFYAFFAVRVFLSLVWK